MLPCGGILHGSLRDAAVSGDMDASFPMRGLLGYRPSLKISNSGVVFGRQFSLVQIGIQPELLGTWPDSDMVRPGEFL
jgi:hypothetical protein